MQPRILWNIAVAPMLLVAMNAFSLSAGLAEAESLRVLASQEVDLGDRKITYNLVEPPPSGPSPTPAAVDSPSEFELAQEARWNSKRHEFLKFSSTVYDGKFTELRWHCDGKEYAVWSNIPFTHLAGVREIETPDTIYSLWMGIGEERSESIAAWNAYVDQHGLDASYRKSVPPAFAGTTPGVASYVFASLPPEGISAEVIAQLNAVHSFYQANRDNLATQYEQRKAAHEARLRYLKEHPPQPKDTVLNFWPIPHASGEEAR